MDLAVLIDVSASMVIWQDAVDELLGVLTRLGAFRDVAAWAFDADAADPGFRPFRRGTAVRRGSASAAEALTKTPGPHAFLVILMESAKHGGTRRWRTRSAAWRGSRLSRVVNPLPHRMWHRSRIRTQLMYQQVTGATDTLAIRQYRTPWSPPEPRQWAPVGVSPQMNWEPGHDSWQERGIGHSPGLALGRRAIPKRRDTTGRSCSRRIAGEGGGPLQGLDVKRRLPARDPAGRRAAVPAGDPYGPRHDRG